NAILHGLSAKNENGKILITFEKLNDHLKCVIFDNGIGREAAVARNKERSPATHRSVGLSITQKRLQLLNNNEVKDLSVTIQDLKDDQGKATGTKVVLYIDFKETNI